MQRFCKNCAYFVIPSDLNYKCFAPENVITTVVSLVTGEKKHLHNTCEEARAQETSCGSRGFWFKEKPGQQEDFKFIGKDYSSYIPPKFPNKQSTGKITLKDLE